MLGIAPHFTLNPGQWHLARVFSNNVSGPFTLLNICAMIGVLHRKDSMLSRLNQIHREYPSRFWSVVGVMFIDRVGGTMLFPFFSLYITQKFSVGMTQAGIILGVFSIFGMMGGMIGGALTDKIGRRSLILFGLVFSALSTLSLGLVDVNAKVRGLSQPII